MMKFLDDKNKVVYLNLHKEQLIRIASSGVEGCSTITYRGSYGENYQVVHGTPEEVHELFFPKPKETVSMVDQMIEATELKRLKEQNKALNNQYKTLLEQSQDVVKELRDLKEQHAGLIKEHDARGKMLLKFTDEREQRQANHEHLGTKYNELVDKANQLTKEKKHLQTLNSNQLTNIKELEDHIKQLESTANRVEDMLTGKCITIINMQ